MANKKQTPKSRIEVIHVHEYILTYTSKKQETDPVNSYTNTSLKMD
jgi:hypothetical protein